MDRNLAIQALIAAVKTDEHYCSIGAAQCDVARKAFKQSQKIFRDLGVPDCAHNRAVVGAKRYEKYMFRHHPFFLQTHQLESLEEMRRRKEPEVLDYEMVHGEYRAVWW